MPWYDWIGGRQNIEQNTVQNNQLTGAAQPGGLLGQGAAQQNDQRYQQQFATQQQHNTRRLAEQEREDATRMTMYRQVQERQRRVDPIVFLNLYSSLIQKYLLLDPLLEQQEIFLQKWKR